jgi:hypothetical protein
VARLVVTLSPQPFSLGRHRTTSLCSVMEMAVPVLPSRDLLETLAFYEALRFENRGSAGGGWTT